MLGCFQPKQPSTFGAAFRLLEAAVQRRTTESLAVACGEVPGRMIWQPHFVEVAAEVLVELVGIQLGLHRAAVRVGVVIRGQRIGVDAAMIPQPFAEQSAFGDVRHQRLRERIARLLQRCDQVQRQLVEHREMGVRHLGTVLHVAVDVHGQQRIGATLLPFHHPLRDLHCEPARQPLAEVDGEVRVDPGALHGRVPTGYHVDQLILGQLRLRHELLQELLRRFQCPVVGPALADGLAQGGRADVAVAGALRDDVAFLHARNKGHLLHASPRAVVGPERVGSREASGL